MLADSIIKSLQSRVIELFFVTLCHDNKYNSIMKKLLCLLLVAFSLTATAQKKVIESKTSFAKDVLQPYVESGELPGAISIFYNNGVQETCCVGYANVEQKRPIGLDNVYMQCSQTKGFCGVTIAKLVEEGKISLDDPVSKYLPEFKELWVQESDKDGVKVLRKAKNVLSVRMVLNHTGGFPFECSAKRADVRGGGWSGGAPLRQIASIAAGSPIMFEPGTRDLYSNTGIDIGAAVVEVVTGMKWEDYLKQEVLEPLGMKSTWFWPTDKQLKTKVELYAFKNNAPAEVAHQVCIIYAVTKGYLNNVAVDQIPEFELRLREHMDSRHYGVLETIRNTGKLEPETEEALKTAISQLVSEFTVAQ